MGRNIIEDIKYVYTLKAIISEEIFLLSELFVDETFLWPKKGNPKQLKVKQNAMIAINKAYDPMPSAPSVLVKYGVASKVNNIPEKLFRKL